MDGADRGRMIARADRRRRCLYPVFTLAGGSGPVQGRSERVGVLLFPPPVRVLITKYEHTKMTRKNVKHLNTTRVK